jgi:hypothetical protein
MKRFHVHLDIDDLAKGAAIYVKLVASEPTGIPMATVKSSFCCRGCHE